MIISEGTLLAPTLIPGDSTMWSAGINVDDHYDAIQCYGDTMELAARRRALVLSGLEAIPALVDVEVKSPRVFPEDLEA